LPFAPAETGGTIKTAEDGIDDENRPTSWSYGRNSKTTCGGGGCSRRHFIMGGARQRVPSWAPMPWTLPINRARLSERILSRETGSH